MLCPGCGRAVPDNALFCQVCGRRILQARTSIPSPIQFSAPPATRRQQILQAADYAKEIDADGNYHPKEFLRKLSREFTLLKYSITREEGTMAKNPVGLQTGEFVGEIQAQASNIVNVGTCTYRDESTLLMLLLFLVVIGVVVGVFTYGIALILTVGLAIWIYYAYRDRFKRNFTYQTRVDVTLEAYLSGEVYEDTRPQANQKKLPITSNLSLIIGGNVRTSDIPMGLPFDQIRASGRGVCVPSLWLPQAVEYWQTKVRADIDSLSDRAEKVRRELVGR